VSSGRATGDGVVDGGIGSGLAVTTSRAEFFIRRLSDDQIGLQCFDAVGWASGRASGL